MQGKPGHWPGFFCLRQAAIDFAEFFGFYEENFCKSIAQIVNYRKLLAKSGILS
jgi:hypothetical protein